MNKTESAPETETKVLFKKILLFRNRPIGSNPKGDKAVGPQKIKRGVLRKSGVDRK